MTADREAELIRHVPTLWSLAEAVAFQDALSDERPFGSEFARALNARMDFLAKREGVK